MVHYVVPEMGCFSNDDGDSRENVSTQTKPTLSTLRRDYFNSRKNVILCRRFFLGLNFWEPHLSLKRERKISPHLLTSSIKRQIRKFHVVVEQ